MGWLAAMSGPRVSVVMPVYNGARYLAGAVDSVLAQTHPDIEIVLVNDGSTDATDAICRRYAAAHPEKVVYVRQENQGVSGALNAGIARMTGDFFCWLSHDDGYVREKVSRQLAFHARLGDPDAVIFTDFILLGEHGETLREVRLKRDKPRCDGLWAILYECINGCSLLVPAHVMRAAGPFEPAYRYVQDYRMWWRMIRRKPFHHLPEPLVYNRIHPAQQTHNPAAIIEGEAFWREVTAEVGPVERALAAGSTLRFYEGVRRQLASGRYPEALAWVDGLVETCVAATPVTVALADDGDDAATLLSMRSVLAQTHSAWELIVVTAPEREAAVRRLAGEEPRVRVVTAEDRDLSSALARAAEVGAGEYLAPLRAGDAFKPRRLEVQLEQTQGAGALVSSSALAGNEGAAEEPAGPHPSTLLVNRAAIGLGLLDAAADEGGLSAQVTAFASRHPVLALRHPLTRAASRDAVPSGGI